MGKPTARDIEKARAFVRSKGGICLVPKPDSSMGMTCHEKSFCDCTVEEMLAEYGASERERILAEVMQTLEFYADKDNWDDDKFTPTIWDNGNIDLGNRARALLAKLRGEG